MAVTGSLQLPHELGICRHYGHTKKHKTVVEKGRLHLLRLPLSSHASRQDVWSLHLSGTIHKPIHSISSSRNVVLCQSFLVPSQANEIPSLKTALVALKRSYNTLHGSPLVLQLIPAAAVVAFALWGLGPLMRHCRNVILHRNDNSWKKSRTYYVLISYLQPLLLWTGATLACRVLDPVILPSAASQAVKQRLLNFVRSLSTVLAFAYCLSSVIQRAQKFFMETNDSTDTRNMGFQFAGKAVYTAVWVAALSLFMELLGFSTQKWVTAGGLGTVLLTLAGREIFTNFLSSVMIHATRPFVVNEWIQTKIEGYEVSGTVEHVGWWSPTIIRGDDREAVHIPNHKFTVNVVRNLSQKTHWRIKTHLAISHLDVNKINNIVADMRKVLAKNPQVEHKRLHRRVFLENVDPENQALLIMISCFVKTSHAEEYLCVKEAILLDLLRVISHHRARLATPIRTVQKFYGDADVENVPFAETIFTRTGTATHHRPFLLIEPLPRINGDDKTKTPSMRTAEEQEPKPAAIAEPKLKDPVSDASQQNGSDKKQQQKKSGKVDGSPTTSPSKLKLEDLDSMGLTSKDITLPGAASEKPLISVSDSIKEKIDTTPSTASKTDNTPSTAKKVDSTPMAKQTDATPSMAKKTDATPPMAQQTDATPPMAKQTDATPSTAKKADPSPPMAKKTDATPMTATSHTKHERIVGPPTVVSRSALEENILLGVALEGSKRTLPIEEEMEPSVSSTEPKELAACRNGNGSLSTGKDNGAQIPVGDTREQER